MKYNLQNKAEVQEVQRKLDEYISAGSQIELTKKNPNRTPSQNKYLHILLEAISVELGERAEYTKEVIFKQIIKVKIARKNMLDSIPEKDK